MGKPTAVRQTRQRLAETLTVASVTVAILFGLAGCRQRPTVSADVAVSIDGEVIRYSQFENYLRGQLDLEEDSFESAVQSELFDQFLDGQLLIRLAIERGLEHDRSVYQSSPDEPPPAAAVGNAVEDRRAIAFLLRDGFQRSWSEEELAAYYEAHQDQFERPAEVHVRQILTHELERAEAAQQALEAGESFPQVSARFSQGPKAHLGGNQGRLAYDDLPPAFRDTIFGLEAGEVSDIVSADYGHLIFQVVERYPAERETLEQVADEIRLALRRRHVDDLVAGLIDEARDRYNVRVFLDNFPFEYRGDYAN